jgi:hydroxymethylbilane synthase
MRDKKTIVVGTRKSLLAMTQTREVVARLRKLFPAHRFLIKGILTSGDRLKTWPQTQIKGLFVKEIEEGLLNSTLDMAVHSMKDLPVELPESLEIAAVTKRLNPADVLISRDGRPLDLLAKGSRVGTSSPRRRMQVCAYRGDLRVENIRGNLATRLRKMRSGMYDAIIIAAAGALRLGWEKKLTQYIPVSVILPAPAQGALGIEVRRHDKRMKRIVKKLDHRHSRIAVTAEREFLKAMGGGCRVPIAALCTVRGTQLRLCGSVAVLEKQPLILGSVSGNSNAPARAGIRLARVIQRRMIKQRAETENKQPERLRSDGL